MRQSNTYNIRKSGIEDLPHNSLTDLAENQAYKKYLNSKWVKNKKSIHNNKILSSLRDSTNSNQKTIQNNSVAKNSVLDFDSNSLDYEGSVLHTDSINYSFCHSNM